TLFRSGNMPSPPNVPIANIAEFAAADYVPPEPIPMPTPDSSSRRVNPNPQPAAASPPRRQPPAAAPSQPAAIQPVAAPVAPVAPPPPPAALRSQAPRPQTPANDLGRSRPLELADSPVLAEAAGLPPTQPTPVQPPMPVKPAERPLFRILVRDADPASPEMANAGSK
ncbi:MAG: hypothetical protein LBU23_08985, partial [Planctomycetota bacterium]|nr:hypothetical protein [Planctomycetota bacterium]